MNVFWKKVYLVGRLLGIDNRNLHSMKKKGRIPVKHHGPILEKGEQIGVYFTREELERTDLNNKS